MSITPVSHSTLKRRALLALCVASFTLTLHADTLRGSMDAYVRQYADADLFSGVVRVTKGDRVVYESAFGLADRGLRVPNTLQTKFHIASLSKPITTTGRFAADGGGEAWPE